MIEVTIDGISQEAIFLIYAERDYTQGTFFDYLNKRLLLVEGDDTRKQARLEDGQPILRNYNDATDLRDIIGRNTDYNIDPKEYIGRPFYAVSTGG